MATSKVLRVVRLIPRIAAVCWIVLAASAARCGDETSREPPQLGVAQAKVGRLPDGQPLVQFTLSNSQGMQVKLLNYGATLTSVRVPDRNGKVENVTLALDSADDYLQGHPLFGSVVGRYANRIRGAKFVLDGREYQLSRNAGENHIHGGRQGFQKLPWSGRAEQDAEGVQVVLSLVSPDGQEGYPGRLEVTAIYRLTDKNELSISYAAKTDKPTHVNLTNHAYWNLAGAAAGDVLSHRLTINADRYLPTDQAKIPTGATRPVAGTPLDFRASAAAGSRIAQVDGGYDHCYVLNKRQPRELTWAARVEEPQSGRVMDVYTTEVGVQLYTANGLNHRYRMGQPPYGPHQGLCLETQHFPDSPNQSSFPSTVLRPGQIYSQKTVHRFSLRK